MLGDTEIHAGIFLLSDAIIKHRRKKLFIVDSNFYNYQIIKIIQSNVFLIKFQFLFEYNNFVRVT